MFGSCIWNVLELLFLHTQSIISIIITVKCMGRVVWVYKQALFRNHRLLSSIPPFTVEAQLCESILGSISAKHPRFRPFVARVCPSTPHSVTSNQGGTSATVDQNGLLMHGTNMDCGRALAPHILVAPAWLSCKLFLMTHSRATYMDRVNPHMKHL